MTVLAVIFLDAEYATRAHAAVTAAAGNPAAELLLGLLAFIRTAHYWTETHPDLPLEPDAIAFLDQHPQLARLLTDPADAVAASPRAAWHAAADDLAARETLAAREQRYRALFESMDAGFNLVQAIPGNGRSRYRVAESNPAQARLTGQPDAAGRPARDLIPGAADELTSCLERVEATGDPARCRILGLFPASTRTAYRASVSARKSPVPEVGLEPVWTSLEGSRSAVSQGK